MSLHRSVRSRHTEVVQVMDKQDAALREATKKSFICKAVEETQNEMHQSSSEGAHNQEAALVPGTVPQGQSKDVTHSQIRNLEDHPEAGGIGDKAKAAVKQLLTEELSRLGDKSLEEIFCMSCRNAQNGAY